jgi:hypothetical protein
MRWTPLLVENTFARNTYSSHETGLDFRHSTLIKLGGILLDVDLCPNLNSAEEMMTKKQAKLFLYWSSFLYISRHRKKEGVIREVCESGLGMEYGMDIFLSLFLVPLRSSTFLKSSLYAAEGRFMPCTLVISP